MFEFILLSIFAYLFGSIPTAFLIGKLKGIDVREIGSKSITETNLARALGWRYGIIGGILDALKGAIPTLLAKSLLTSNWQIILIAFLPTLGHDFPIFFKFKHGGRGASTFFGASLTLVGIKFFLPLFVVWFLIFSLTKMTGLTNFIFPWIFSIFLYFWHKIGFFPFEYFVFGILEAILINFALRNNIKRLLEGKEHKTPFKF
jgi:glycerol-3-phosphate acyltransferase PlsY